MRARAREGWHALRQRLASRIGLDAGLENFLRWLGNTLLNQPEPDVLEALRKIDGLIEKAAGKERPAAWLMGAVKQPQSKGGFGYRPNGRRNGS